MRIKPSDNPPPCQWFDQQVDSRQDEKHECGKPSEHKVKVLGAFTKAFVYLCEEHNQAVNRGFAEKRRSEAS